MRNVISAILILTFLSSCSKNIYQNKSAAEVSKSTIQVEGKTSSGRGYIYKTQNNEVVFMQNTTPDKFTFDKVVVVAFEKDIPVFVETKNIDYVNAIYFKTKRSLLIHSKKNNTTYLFGLNEKQSFDKSNLLKQDGTLKNNEIKTVFGYGFSVLSGSWDLKKFMNTGATSAFDGLAASSNIKIN